MQLRENVRAGPSLSPSEFPSEVQDAVSLFSRVLVN